MVTLDFDVPKPMECDSGTRTSTERYSLQVRSKTSKAKGSRLSPFGCVYYTSEKRICQEPSGNFSKETKSNYKI